MPCTYYETPAEKAQNQRKELAPVFEKIYRPKLDKLTRMLCAVLGDYEEKVVDADAFDNFLPNNPEIKTWWAKHKDADEKRRAKEIRKPRKR